MGLLTFSINVTLDGCVDHQEGIVDDETHAFFTRLMDEAGAMLWGRPNRFQIGSTQLSRSERRPAAGEDPPSGFHPSIGRGRAGQPTASISSTRRPTRARYCSGDR
jgi:hypothetical protein